MRPCARNLPALGALVPERSLSKVDFPAPFAPIRPSDAPRANRKPTSRRAQCLRCRCKRPRLATSIQRAGTLG